MVNLVTFPGLGLEFLLNRVVIEILGRPIYWYGLIIATGFLIGVTVCAKLAPGFGIDEEHIYDFLFYAVPAALVGLRAYFVIFYLDNFKNSDGSLDWPSIFRISDGGMAIYGGIIAGVIVLYFFTKTRKLNFFLLADISCVGLVLGQGIGRWGNFTNVEAYGGLTAGPWRMCSSSIAYEMAAKGYANEAQYEEILAGTLGVHPTFFYESMWNFLGFLLLYRLAKKTRTFEGQICFSYFAWYGFGRAIIEGMRTDSLYFFGLEFLGYPLRTSQMLSFILCTGSLAVLLLAKAGKIPVLKPLNISPQETDKTSDGKEKPFDQVVSLENSSQEEKKSK